MDKAWITPPTAVPLIRQGVSFRVAGGSVFVSPGGQFLMSLDTFGAPALSSRRTLGPFRREFSRADDVFNFIHFAGAPGSRIAAIVKFAGFRPRCIK